MFLFNLIRNVWNMRLFELILRTLISQAFNRIAVGVSQKHSPFLHFIPFRKPYDYSWSSTRNVIKRRNSNALLKSLTTKCDSPHKITDRFYQNIWKKSWKVLYISVKWKIADFGVLTKVTFLRNLLPRTLVAFRVYTAVSKKTNLPLACFRTKNWLWAFDTIRSN